MKVRGIEIEDFINYKSPSMFIAIGTCDWKCCVEGGMTAKEIGELYLGSQTTHTEYFFFNYNKEIVPIANLSSLEFIILGNLEDVVENVITYPFLSPYKDVYIRYVTSPIVDNTI